MTNLNKNTRVNWFEDLYNRQTYFDLYAEADTRLAPQEVEGIISLLQLEPGQKILDVCCGYGRHAIELAKNGYKVTGVDLSPKQIAVAVARAQEAGVQVDFLVCDAREMEFREEFDVALNLFTSFGFFDDEAQHLKMLQRIADATVPNGCFLMDLWNREKQIRDFTLREIEERSDGIRIEKAWRFDPWNGRINWENTVVFPDGQRENWGHSIRAYTLVELRKMLGQVGFELERVYGDFAGSTYTIDAPQMITIARKIGS
jgi:SAM-dependent methyltransferase